MSPAGFEIQRFGPLVKGAVDAANPVVDLTGAMRYARNAIMDGVGRLLARPGTAVAMTFKDDQGSPANVTSIVAITAFGDGALVVGHSTVTSKFYLYRVTSDFTAWYNAGGVQQANTTAQPVAVLWSSAATVAKVFVAEGLGKAYIAHNNAGSSFKSKVYSVAAGLVDLQADLRGSGLEDTYFRGFVAFQQHLWGWGYGSQAASDNDRPELLRYGLPNFATTGGGYFQQNDNFTVGHRVRSIREGVVGAVVAGPVLYVGTKTSIWPVTGFGRNSWDKARPLDDAYGFAGPLAAVSANQQLYYWSERGPLRVSGLQRPEPLWDAVTVAAGGVVSPSDIVAVFDPDRDQAMFLYRNATTGRVSALAAFDIRRDAWLGPDGDIGLGVASAALVTPVSVAGPTAPPNTPSTTGIGSSVATGNLVAGDTTPGTKTIWEIKLQADSVWTTAAETEATTLAYQFTGLTPGGAYEWRAKHQKNGQDSAYLGPTVATQFTTSLQLNAPTACSMSGQPTPCRIFINWHNSGEEGVSTEVYFGSVNPPTTLVGTMGPGVASKTVIIDNPPTLYYARVRHIKTGRTPSNYSNVASRSQTCINNGGEL